MAITYNAGTNTIQITGYTEGTPANFTDIYNADVAGGWGKVTRQCANQFCFNCYLHIGDGSTATWFADKGKAVFWQELGVTWERYIQVTSNAHFRLGVLINDTKKSTREGCSISTAPISNSKRLICGIGDTADIQVYSSMIGGYSNQRVQAFDGELASFPTVKVYNTILNNASIYAVNLNLYNVTITGDRTIASTFGVIKVTGDVDVLNLFNLYYPIYTTSDSTDTYKNVVAKDYTTLFVASGGTMTIINGDLDVWTFGWGSRPSPICYRKYELDLKVIDKDNVAINGATVKIWDKDSNLIVDTTTNASGVITTQTITRGYYNLTNGDTLQEASPHLIKITKAGYTTYEADFTLEEKTDWLIALQAAGGGLLRNPSMTGGMV